MPLPKIGYSLHFVALKKFFWVLKKDVSFATIRVSTPRRLTSPFGDPTYLPLWGDVVYGWSLIL